MDIDDTNTVLLGTTDPEIIMKRQTKLILPQLPIQHKRCFHLTLSLKIIDTAHIVANRPGIPWIVPETVSASLCPGNLEFCPGFSVSRGAPSALDIFLYLVAC